MRNSALGLASLVLGLAGLFLCWNIWGIIPCIVAIILGIIALTDYLAYKWSSMCGISLAIMAIAVMVYRFGLPVAGSRSEAEALAAANLEDSYLSNDVIPATAIVDIDFEIVDKDNRLNSLSEFPGAIEVFEKYLRASYTGDAKTAESLIDRHFVSTHGGDAKAEEINNQYINAILNTDLAVATMVDTQGLENVYVGIEITDTGIAESTYNGKGAAVSIGYTTHVIDWDTGSEGIEFYVLSLAETASGWKVINANES